MPYLYESPPSFSIIYDEPGWYFPGVTLPGNATAAILRFASSGSSGYAQYAVVPRYEENDNSTEWELWAKYHTVYVNNTKDWIVPWDGRVANGRVAFYLNRQSGVTYNVYVLGYFTDAEFVRFDSRHAMQVEGANPYQVTNILSESWYNDEATAYLGCGSYNNSTQYIAPVGWMARMASSVSQYNQVFWPDSSGNVWTNRSGGIGDKYELIGGYFICNMYKGEYPTCERAFVAKDKPQATDNVWLTGYSIGDLRRVLGICTAEYENITFSGPFSTTRPGGYTSTRWSTLPTTYHFDPIYLYPNPDGVFDLKTFRYDWYNRDRFLLYAAFIRTQLIEEVSSAFGDEPMLQGPDIHQGEVPAFAVPIAYTTRSGEYAWSGVFEMRLSGGAANPDPSASTGGAMSSSNAGTDLFDQITNRMAQTGVTDYRGLYLHNPHTETAYGVLLWLGDTTTTGLSFSVGLAPDAELQSIATDEVAPAGVVFSCPSSENNGLWVGNLGPGESIGLWLRRTVDAQNAFSGQETVRIYLSAMNNG